MKGFCGLLVVLAVFSASESKYVNPIQRLNNRTPFFQRRVENVSPSIVGGQPANIADFPHHLALLDLSLGGYICGASNIAPLWALSAAHCLEMGTPPALVFSSTFIKNVNHLFISYLDQSLGRLNKPSSGWSHFLRCAIYSSSKLQHKHT